MQKHQIQSVIIRKKYRVQNTDSNHMYTVVENHLLRDFQAVRPAEKCVSDLTYIRTGEGWLYLTVVLDQAGRKAVGFALSETMETMETMETTVATFQLDIKTCLYFIPFCFTLTGGVQYACSAFRAKLVGMSVMQSMSRKGNCWDKAVAESFIKTMRQKWYTTTSLPPDRKQSWLFSSTSNASITGKGGFPH